MFDKIIHWKRYKLKTTRKIAHNHMLKKLINMAYITKFLHINCFRTIDLKAYMCLIGP